MAKTKRTRSIGEREVERWLWAPSRETAVSILLLPRVMSAMLRPLDDCDEVYNYWEPMHFLLHNFGFQTWEYSPVYALRSYLYIGSHAIVSRFAGSAISLGSGNGITGYATAEQKMLTFYALRGALAIASAYSEAYFYDRCRKRFGRATARYLLWILVFNAGMFYSSTAFLPSSTVMYLVTAFTGAWMDQQYNAAMFCGIVAVVSGWPYVGVLFLPFAVEAMYHQGVVRSIVAGALMLLGVVGAEVGVNYYYYQQLVLPAWNIVVYNVFSSDKDSTLYGVDSWYYYLFNLLLNFNILLPLALLGALLQWNRLHALKYLSPMYLWLMIMTLQPHKEERFLFPIYPLLCLSAAMTIRSVGHHVKKVVGRRLTHFAISCGLLVYTLASLSSIFSKVENYSAPLRLYAQLAENHLPQDVKSMYSAEDRRVTTVCVGKEWHRFPSSFFLPSNSIQLAFVKSGFTGILPKHFETHENATSIIPTHMNDRNEEEPSRYVELDQCDYFVDLELKDQEEVKLWENTGTWERLGVYGFIDAEHSKAPYRSFYIPYLSEKNVQYAPYVVYRRRKA